MLNSNSPILGAICGDIIGSVYEKNSVKTMDFDLFPSDSRFTDDTVMTCAIASWFIQRSREVITPASSERLGVKGLIHKMQVYGRGYPDRGYGHKFYEWLYTVNPLPYKSYANGSAMRVSPVGVVGKSLQDTLDLAALTATVTHNHPEAIKGAQAVASCIYLSRNGKSKEEIKDYVEKTFKYNLHRTIDSIRDSYTFHVDCQRSVPESIICWLESDSYEETIRRAISLGGDADTMACIAGSIAAVGMEIPNNIIEFAKRKLDPDLLNVIETFDSIYLK
jgi:ADP-ribosylglycohydrolase